MNESDLISAYQAAEQIWQTYVSIFISVLFAYFVAAYLVGAKLSRSQAYIVTGLYAFFSSADLFYLWTIFSRMEGLGRDIHVTNPARLHFASFENQSSPWAHLVLWGPFLGAFVAGLVFMFQVRHKAKKRTNRSRLPSE